MAEHDLDRPETTIGPVRLMFSASTEQVRHLFAVFQSLMLAIEDLFADITSVMPGRA